MTGEHTNSPQTTFFESEEKVVVKSLMGRKQASSEFKKKSSRILKKYDFGSHSKES